ncbi:MAG TPA: aminopeptidase P family protein [Bryobacteraceae bacterium]|nr:aminopeptidase P family protein [Bryobacteraceae bacterium]
MHPRRILAVFCLAAASLIAQSPWKVAPAPPASWQRDRIADLTARRRAVMDAIGAKGILILYAAEPRNYAGDVDWPFRQENNFYYLTALNQPGSALVLIPGAESVREVLFLPPSNPDRESWTGHLLTPAEAREISGIQQVWDSRHLATFLNTILPQAKTPEEPRRATNAPAGQGRGGRGGRGPSLPPAQPIPIDLNQAFSGTIQSVAGGQADVYMLNPARNWQTELPREHEFAARLSAASPAVAVKDATPVFSKLRAIKSPRELDILRHTEAITAEAFQRAYTVATPGTPEYEIQAQFEFTFLRRNAHWGYPCIVGSGVNATTLHYETNRGTIHPGDLLLMDDAAEFDGYSVDVTRTIPVDGKFTKEQADIYRLVYAAQQAGIANAKPGHRSSGVAPDSINGAAVKVFKEGLLKLGLITDPNSDQYRIWFNHGISHGIGLNVHDPGASELAPGMVVTVEPGLYFRPDALEHLEKTPENEQFIAAVRPAFERYKGIGVRIEDDVLVTNGQPEVISSAVPSKLEDVEATIAQLRQARISNPLP